MDLFSGQDWRYRHKCVDMVGGKGMGQIGMLGLTCIHYRIYSRWLVGSCCIAQGAQIWCPVVTYQGVMGVGVTEVQEGVVITHPDTYMSMRACFPDSSVGK